MSFLIDDRHLTLISEFSTKLSLNLNSQNNSTNLSASTVAPLISEIETQINKNNNNNDSNIFYFEAGTYYVAYAKLKGLGKFFEKKFF
jgi:hypothetical protein